jgi:acetamidase/formamidase
VSAIDGLDRDRVYPLAGPIAVHGAQPGDTLAIEILDIHTQGWGWTAVLPGLGLLPEDFPDAYCASSTSRTATLPSCARTSRSPSSRSSARWASAPPGRAPSP